MAMDTYQDTVLFGQSRTADNVFGKTELPF